MLIGNTGGDRLIDWVGEFNSYLVPFAPFGMATVSRTLQPQLAEFLYALSESQGVDLTRQPDTGNLPVFRNGEPDGELGVVRQKDFAWHDQTGGPADPQAGNMPGGKRDVLRTANFNDGTLQGFAVDSGTWTVTGGRLTVAAASLGGDAASVFNLSDYLPSYFEVQASITVVKPTAGWKANAYIIFDYESKDAFKFAGIDVSTNKLVIGHRDAAGWVVDRQTPFNVKVDTFYNMLLSVNGLTATLVVDNAASITMTWAARVIDGYTYGLNCGFVGFGSNNSRGTFDNVAVKTLPPQITRDSTAAFDGDGDAFNSVAGTWTVAGGRDTATPPTAGSAVATLEIGLAHGLRTSSALDLDATVRATAIGGIAFDVYGLTDYKFVALDIPGQRVLVGHVDRRRGWVVDATFSRTLASGVDQTLSLSLRGATVSVSVGGLLVGSYAYAAAVVDGAFGMLARGADASFDSFRTRTDDPAFALPSVSIGDATTAEGASGTSAVTLTLTLSAPATSATSVNWSTAAATATAGSDFIAASGSVSFAAGQTSATINVTVNGDTTIEPDETFTVTLSAPTGLTLGPATGTVTITNDDTPTLSISDATVAEGNSGTKTVTLTVTLSAASPSPVTVVASTQAAGTGTSFATAGTDYVTRTGVTLTFAAGATTATFTVTVNGDRTVEPSELFWVVLTSPTNATINKGTGVVTITNDDLLATAAGPGDGAAQLTLGDARAVLRAAKQQWVTMGVAAERLAAVSVRVADLGGLTLGFAEGNVIVLDRDAAGWGWNIDPRRLVSAGRIDLLTVLLHELGHVLGLTHTDNGLMAEALAPGVRLSVRDQATRKAPKRDVKRSARKCHSQGPRACNSRAKHLG